MTEKPSIAMQKTLALFDVSAPEDTDVEWFVRWLDGRDWTTAEQILTHLGQKPTEEAKRWLRSLADRSNGRVIGFSKGYKLTKDLADGEYDHWRNTFKKSAKSILDRVLRTDQVRGWKGNKDE